MRIKFLITVFFGLLFLLVWTERFLTRKKHNISAPRRVLRGLHDFFWKKNNPHLNEKPGSWTDAIPAVLLFAALMTFVFWDSLA